MDKWVYKRQIHYNIIMLCLGENVKDLMFRVVALTFNQMVASETSGRNNREAKSIGNNLSKLNYIIL